MISLVLLQGIVFNHALNIAAQKAAARGGMDSAIQREFQSRLLPGTRIPDNYVVDSQPTPPIQAFTVEPGPVTTPIGGTDNLGGVGRELTKFGEVFCVRGRYMPTGASLLGMDKLVARTITVSSQSSQEASNPNEVPQHQPCSEAP